MQCVSDQIVWRVCEQQCLELHIWLFAIGNHQIEMSIAKRLNQNSCGWSFFGLFLGVGFREFRWFLWLSMLCIAIVKPGKAMNKDNTIAEYMWALQPLADFSPSQPIHQDSLFQILQKVLSNAAEGEIWLAVYDLKTLLQHLWLIQWLNFKLFSWLGSRAVGCLF